MTQPMQPEPAEQYITALYNLAEYYEYDDMTEKKCNWPETYFGKIKMTIRQSEVIHEQ